MTERTATLGTIVKAVGRKGEVKLLPGPDFWSDALVAGELDLVSEGDDRRSVHVEGYRAKGNTFILKLDGIETIDDAESVVGDELRISLEGLDESIGPKKLLPCQAMGLKVVLPDGNVLGEVVDMLLGSQQNCFIVGRDEERFLIPDVPGMVRRVDLVDGSMEVDLPEGLLDLRW